MPNDPGPIVRRRQLGSALRHYRLAADLTVTAAASRLLVDPSKISRIENAQRSASVRDVRDLCDIYDVTDEAIRDQLMELAVGSRKRAWWQEANLPPALQTLIGMEGSARRIIEFEVLAIPGLLQTPDYARSITPLYLRVDAMEAQMAIDARMRRQQIFDQEHPPQFDVILDEAVLHRMVGGRAVMREQIDHLIKMADAPLVTLRIIPFEAGAHVGMTGGFIILEFASVGSLQVAQAVQSVVYLEAFNAHSYHDQPAEIKKYLAAYQQLTSQAADERDSRKLLRKVRAAL
jgi:transcriptional regulator with XRE-family HTH domain